MIEYSQGIAADGPAILKDGQPMTPEQIVSELNGLNEIGMKLLNHYEEPIEYAEAEADWLLINKHSED